jgi:GNAT superfamily N-acetyltransferase
MSVVGVVGSGLSYRIRPGTAADLPVLVRLAREFLAETPYGRLWPPDDATIGRVIQTTLEHGAAFVAEAIASEQLTQVVGMIGVVLVPSSPHPHVDEVAWYVSKDFRGGSLGPRLLAAAERWACTQGAGVLKMVAPVGSSVGEFLERRGYTAVETAYMRPLIVLPSSPASLVTES